MRKSRLKRIILAALQLASISLLLSLPALAQSSAPVTPVPVPTGGKTLSENIAALSRRAGEMIPTLKSELESPLLDWFEGSVKAAGQVRDVAFEAGRLHALSTVIHSVGHNLAREIEQGLALRY